MRALLAALALLGILGGSALAQHADQVRLTSPLIEGFLAAYPDLSALAADFVTRYGDRSEGDGGDPVESLPAYQDIPEARSRTSAVLAGHGFSGLDQFLALYTAVLVAYPYAVPTGPQPPDVAREKRDAAEAIAQDRTLSPEKKTEALQQLDEQYATLFDSVPPPGNVDAVRPFVDRLKAIADRP